MATCKYCGSYFKRLRIPIGKTEKGKIRRSGGYAKICPECNYFGVKVWRARK